MNNITRRIERLEQAAQPQQEQAQPQTWQELINWDGPIIGWAKFMNETEAEQYQGPPVKGYIGWSPEVWSKKAHAQHNTQD